MWVLRNINEKHQAKCSSNSSGRIGGLNRISISLSCVEPNTREKRLRRNGFLDRATELQSCYQLKCTRPM